MKNCGFGVCFPVLAKRAMAAVAFLGALLVAGVAQAKEEVIGDWRLVCDEGCVLAQGLANPDKPGVVYALQVTKVDGGKQALLQLNFPLGVYLPPGLGFSVANIKRELPMTVCLPVGCRAILGADKELLAALQSADKAMVRFYLSEKNPMEIAFSLKGFSEAYKKL